MAVKFLNSLDVSGNGGLGITLNNTELTSFKVDNVTSDPAVTGEGQMIYRTDTNALKFYNGTSWVTLGDASAAGTVTSVAFTHGGNAFSKTVTDPTGDAAIAVTMAGAATQYINGLGNLALLSSLPQGDITAILAGDGLTGSNLSGPIPTIDVDYAGTDNIIVAAGAGTIATTDIIMYSDSATSDVSTATIASILALAPQGDITAVNGGTYLTATSSGGPVVTINHDSTTRSDTTSTASPAFGATFTAVDSVTTNTTGHVTALNLKTVTLPTETAPSFTSLTLAGSAGTDSTIVSGDTISILAGTNISTTGNGTDGVTIAYTGGTGSMSSWTLSGDSGPSQTISNGNTVDIAGGTYATTVASATDRVTVNVDGTTAATASKLIARDGSGYGYVITPSSGDSSTKIATTAFVQASLTGLLEFKGGFNATTGAIVGGGNLTSGGTRVAVEVGDYYVVTVAGNFFGNASTPLTPGDSVIVQTAAAAGVSVEGDFIVVQSDTDLATNSTVGLMYINPSGSGISSNISSGAATLTNTDKGSSQNIFKNVASSSGTAVADNNNDTLTIVGAGGASTAVTGDTLTITAQQRAAGTGLSLSGNTINANVAGTQSVAANTSSSTSSRTYKVQVDSGDNLVVNVPWSNTNSGGTVTGVSASHEGNAFTATVTNANSTPDIDIDVVGFDTQYINGEGNLVTFPTIPQGDITAVNASTVNNRLGIGVTSSTGPVPVVGLSINTLGTVVPASGDSIPVYDTSATINKRTTVDSLAKTIRGLNSAAITIATPAIGNNVITYPFTLSNLENVMIQLIDTITHETVESVVDRTSTTQATIKFGTLPPNPIKVLVQIIG